MASRSLAPKRAPISGRPSEGEGEARRDSSMAGRRPNQSGWRGMGQKKPVPISDLDCSGCRLSDSFHPNESAAKESSPRKTDGCSAEVNGGDFAN